ncbi:hypothetical protein ARMGADRAFT_1092646 [Armillaria gallica]|uniref:Uncharacterized protein n=1 Tax=Armillaria gallica TaxID=47427 RepID=A0A2H3CF39_ARMGA|nr:hypothetical protein ARMGADRAFT_1092646 [Armillaria gallica]
MPANYDARIFEWCLDESGLLVETVTLQQCDASAPIPPYSQCTTVPSIAGATAIGPPADD